MNKKAQSQIITTVLIILLVLAAIVIVWQVVSGTIKSGAEEIETQSLCLGLTLEVTSADTLTGMVTIRPNKDIEGFRIYAGGAQISPSANDTTQINAYSTSTEALSFTAGQEITTASSVGGTWCDGLSSKVAV